MLFKELKPLISNVCHVIFEQKEEFVSTICETPYDDKEVVLVRSIIRPVYEYTSVSYVEVVLKDF